MTESESRAYLESVWGNVDLSPYHGTEHLAVRVGGACFVNFDTGGAESLTKAVAYTKKLLAEIAELREDISVYKALVTGRAMSIATLNALVHAAERAESILAEKRAGMKEGK